MCLGLVLEVILVSDFCSCTANAVAAISHQRTAGWAWPSAMTFALLNLPSCMHREVSAQFRTSGICVLRKPHMPSDPIFLESFFTAVSHMFQVLEWESHTGLCQYSMLLLLQVWYTWLCAHMYCLKLLNT